MKFRKYISYNKRNFVAYAKDKDSRSKSYLERIKVMNIEDNRKYSLNFDIFRIYKDNYIYYGLVSDYLQKEAQRDNKVAIFITATLPSEYHPYKLLNGKYIKNNRYKNFSIHEGYKKLSAFFRYLYNSFKIKRKKHSVKYVRVIEPHKDFTPHLHAIVFVENEYLEYFKKHFLNSIKLFNLGEQYKFEVINNINSATSYLLKYINKSFNSDDEKAAYVFEGWKRANKIRVFTYSYIPVSREVFKVARRFLDLKSDSKNYNMLENLENRLFLKIDYYKYNRSKKALQKYNTKSLFNTDARYIMYVKKIKKQTRDFSYYYDVLDSLKEVSKNIDLDYTYIYKSLENVGISLKELHNFYCLDYCNYMIDYISDDYDYRYFFDYMDREDFLSLVEDYIDYICDDVKYRYIVDDIKIFDKYNEEFLFDKSKWRVIFDFSNLTD